MTILMLVDGEQYESPSAAVRARIREELAKHRLSMSEVARRLGVPQQKLSRRMTGQTPMDVDEIDEICRAADLSYVYITTGIRALPGGTGPGTAQPVDEDLAAA